MALGSDELPEDSRPLPGTSAIVTPSVSVACFDRISARASSSHVLSLPDTDCESIGVFTAAR